MLSPDGRQLAAMTWTRNATPIGTDNPSLSRVGDALQFVEPFADDAAIAIENARLFDETVYGRRAADAGTVERMRAADAAAGRGRAVAAA